MAAARKGASKGTGTSARKAAPRKSGPAGGAGAHGARADSAGAAGAEAEGAGPDGKKPRRSRKVKVEPGSRGLAASAAVEGAAPPEIGALGRQIADDGGSVIGAFRDPLGGRWQVLASLPLAKVKPTPFQRDLSEPHVERLAKAIATLDRFLDPVVAVRTEAGEYWVPNGYHRSEAMKKLGAKAITAIVMPDLAVAYQILALNTEKAHNLREKSLEVIRMARSLSTVDSMAPDPMPEERYAATFEEAPLLTLGICYEERPRFSGGAYHSVLKRIDGFLPDRLPAALEKRKDRAARLFALEDAVAKAIAALKARGFESPYLRNFVLARVNPLRFQRASAAPFEETLFESTIEKMRAAAERFDAAKVKADQVAATGGPPPE